MRSALLALPLLALVPAPAGACTLDNCVEVRTAHATWHGDDLHSMGAACVVAGRSASAFTVLGTAQAHDGRLPYVATRVTVRCIVRNATGVVYDSSATTPGVAVLAGTFTSSPNVSVCVSATASFGDGHSVSVYDC